MRQPESGKIGRYELLSKVGQGANGVVYRAQDPTIRRVVALKVLAAEATAAESETTASRSSASIFEREAHAAGALLHPNIVTLYDAGRDGEWYYLAMEFIEGGTFASEIESGVSLDRAVEVAAVVADALDYAHEHGVVHRDIKPANLMILPDQTVKVADFGIARLTSATTTMTSDMMVGTPHYMSPEQVQGGKIDGRSDLFSLGVVLYEALTGKKPFAANSLAAILNRILRGEVQPPAAENPEVPASLSAMVMKAMAKDPNVRYARGRELAAELRSFLRERRGETTPSSPRPAASRWAAAAGGIGLLAAAAAAGFLFVGGETAEAPPRTGLVQFTSEIPLVEVYRDGSRIGTTPFVLELPAGRLELEFRKEGYHPAPITATVEADKRNRVDVPPMVALDGR